MPDRRCARPACRALFTPRRENQLYHTEKCRKLAHIDRKDETIAELCMTVEKLLAHLGPRDSKLLINVLAEKPTQPRTQVEIDIAAARALVDKVRS